MYNTITLLFNPQFDGFEALRPDLKDDIPEIAEGYAVLGTGMEVEPVYFQNTPPTKTRFGDNIKRNFPSTSLGLPLGLLDFSPLNGFKNAGNVSGTLQLSFGTDGLQIEGLFIPTIVGRSEIYQPKHSIKYLEDLKSYVEHASWVFGGVSNWG